MVNGLREQHGGATIPMPVAAQLKPSLSTPRAKMLAFMNNRFETLRVMQHSSEGDQVLRNNAWRKVFRVARGRYIQYVALEQSHCLPITIRH